LCVEKASIDEAFIDFTRPVREEILKRYPYLAEVPANAPLGKDTPLPPPPPISWDGLGVVIPVSPPPDKTEHEAAHESATAEAEDEVTVGGIADGVYEDDRAITWHDVALSIAAEFMEQIRRDIYTKLGYSTSAASRVSLFFDFGVDAVNRG
jgi:DNA polymerase eta